LDQTLQEIYGVLKWEIDLAQQQVMVIGTINAVELQRLLETNTGMKTILRGQGAIADNLGCAYTAIRERFENGLINDRGKVIGVVRFIQLSENRLLVEAELDGLVPGLHGIHIHEYGDLSHGYKGIGDHYNPHSGSHGSPTDKVHHYGDLGNILADQKGHGHLRLTINDEEINVWNLIGRSVCVKKGADQFTSSVDISPPPQQQEANDDEPLACGIIARSSGVSQNPKKICDCSGITLWESDPTDVYTA